MPPTRNPQAPPALVALLDLVALMHDQEAAAGQQAAAAHRFLSESLHALADLLARAPQGLSVRQVLLMVLKSAPVKAYQQEAWQGTIQAVKDCEGALLDTPGNDASYRVGVAQLRLEETRWQKEFVAQAARKAARARDTSDRYRKAEGLEDPYFPRTGIFRWKRKEHRFGLRQWRLLKALWGGRALDASAVLLEVYESDALANNKLWSLQHDLNDTLRARKLLPPFAVWRPSPLKLRLQKPPGLR
jgi:hypothetical protein